MDARPRGLLLLFEGLPPTVIESQVGRLVAWLAASEIAEIDVLSFACSATEHAAATARLDAFRAALPGLGVSLVRGIRPALPWSLAWHRARLARYLDDRRGRYRFIHARTNYAAAVAAPPRARRGLGLLWDCRGDAAAEFEMRAASGRLSAVVYRAYAAHLRGQAALAARACDHALFVTEELAEPWRTVLGERPCDVVPCLADGDLFRPDAVKRSATRRRFGFSDTDTVYVYSGSMRVYQGFGLALDYFERVSRRDSSARLLVITPDRSDANRTMEAMGSANYTLTAAELPAMPELLNAADIALMLRPPSAVNRAAFPTKFAEFALLGLPVVMNDHVPACARQARALGLYVAPDAPAVPRPWAEREQSGAAARRRLTREAYAEVYRAVYGALGGTHPAPQNPMTGDR